MNGTAAIVVEPTSEPNTARNVNVWIPPVRTREAAVLIGLRRGTVPRNMLLS